MPLLGNNAFVRVLPVQTPEVGLLEWFGPTNTDQGVKPRNVLRIHLELTPSSHCVFCPSMTIFQRAMTHYDSLDHTSQLFTKAGDDNDQSFLCLV